jgi:hypothetical protein
MSETSKSGKARSEHIPSGLLPRADIVDAFWHFRFMPTFGLMHRSKSHSYSITSSARCWRCGGTLRPRALAVFRLMTNSNLKLGLNYRFGYWFLAWPSPHSRCKNLL